jgi:hypothetical protein
VGCGRDELVTRYGRHRNSGDNASVNGTDVLADMFTAAGHDVHFRRTLVTSEMEAADIVVWFPDTEAAPSEKVCEWFDTWLSEYSGRTLIYVGRDYSAGPAYFDFLTEHRLKQQGKSFPTKEAKAAGKKDKSAKEDKQTPDKSQAEKSSEKEVTPPTKEPEKSGETPAKKDKKSDAKKDDAKKEDLKKEDDEQPDCEWFVYQPGEFKEVRTLSGPWAKGIDAAKADVELRTRLTPHGEVEELLTSDGDLLAASESRSDWDGSQIIYIANGSFLLNLPQVNHEHRKLAGKLVDAVGEPGNVVFLESGRGGPPIDPPHTDNSVWTLFKAWPLGVILLQLAAVGVLYCFAQWPIFGRPRQPAAEPAADFSKHVAAVGRLLARTKDRQFALDRVSPSETTENPTRLSAALPLNPKGT